MAKQAKDTQTQWTRQGKEIADTAVPLYESNLLRIDDYLSDPTANMQTYLDKYYNPKTSAQYSDFMRNYNRAMANTTANNYSATSGGYTSSGQRAYDDMQRYQNDLASRLQDYGVANAYQMAAGDFGNMLNANRAYNDAYGLGKNYSDIERYNNMVRQANSGGNILGQAMSGVGKIFSTIPLGWTQAVGAGLQGAGGLMSVDTSNLSSRLGAGSAQGYGSGTAGGIFGDTFANLGQGLVATTNNPNSWLYGTKFGQTIQQNPQVQSGLFTSNDPYTAKVRRS